MIENSAIGPAVSLIGGPTASGKSALALRLAEAIGAEVVNADSMQLYADLRVLTARPSPADEARAPHHLYGSADAAQAWSVGRWLRAAEPQLAAIAGRGRPAVVTGGTGLYFRALTQGLAAVPEVGPAEREAAAGELDRLGETGLRQRLAVGDPQAAARIAPGDRQRLIRAWSVLCATGRSLTAWQERAATPAALAPGAYTAVVLEPPRPALYARCDARAQAMAGGAGLEEVRRLLARGLDPELPAMKAIGVRELGGQLAGRCTPAEALAHMQMQTRRYAKRQATWFRGQAPAWPRIAAVDPQAQWAALARLVGLAAA